MLTRLLMLCAAALIAASLWAARTERDFIPLKELPDGFSSYGLALQFAAPDKGAEYVPDIVGPEGHANRDAMRRQVDRDALVIAAYAMFFVAAGLCGVRRGPGWRRIAGGAAAAVGLAAACADVAENLALLSVLHDPSVDVAFRARAKWLLFFLASACTAVAVGRHDGMRAATATFFGLSAALGLATLALDGVHLLRTPALIFGAGLLAVLATPIDDWLDDGFVGAIGRIVRRFDRWLRERDFAMNRTAGGPLGAEARHPLVAATLPALIVFFAFNGPSLRWDWRLGVSGLVAWASFFLFRWLLGRNARLRWAFAQDVAGQCAVVAALAGVAWWIAPPRSSVHDNGPAHGIPWLPLEAIPYENVLMVLALVFAAVILIGSILAGFLFAHGRRPSGIPARLSAVELFRVPPKPPPVTGWMLLLAALEALMSNPGRLLYLPSLATLLVPRAYVEPTFVVLLAASWILLAYARLDARFSASWYLLYRLVFGGWAWVVSLLVIALGVCRFLDVQYVSTVIDGARNYTLTGYVIAAYALTWWFDYWMTSTAATRLLDLLGGPAHADAGRIPYVVPAARNGVQTPEQGRVIQLHGAGRLLAFHEERTHWHGYSVPDLIDALSEGLPDQDATRLDLVWMKWRVSAHALLASVLLAAGVGMVAWAMHRQPQVAQVKAIRKPNSFGGYDPATTIFPEAACKERRPVLAVAASGGGTRAALYTTSILWRLQRAGRLKDVTVVSGVSGGGAALTYFAANRTLLIADASDPAWKDFFSAMREPYIEDVIDGSGEWRMAGGHRLGHLLAESFKRRWKWHDAKTFEEVEGIGLILNSAIGGRFLARREGETRSLAEAERLPTRRGLSDVAGGRVVYTNLELPDHFGEPGLIKEVGDGIPPRETRDTRLPVFMMTGDNVDLADAAAAAANFPPVFPNAAVDRVDLDPRDKGDYSVRFWVTDGGAIDNRGIETLLMAIRHAARTRKNKPCLDQVPLEIIGIEASGESKAYNQDRGLGSLMAGGAAFASQLDGELLRNLRKSVPNARFHHLPMPRLLRQAGSFGTHWMMQRWTTVCEDPHCRKSIVLRAPDVEYVLNLLCEPPEKEPSPEVRAVLEFIRRDEGDWTKQWERFAGRPCTAAGPVTSSARLPPAAAPSPPALR